MNNSHEWQLVKGSNITYRCARCGVFGHLLDKYTSSLLYPEETKQIVAHKQSPYGGDCDLNLINHIASS